MESDPLDIAKEYHLKLCLTHANPEQFPGLWKSLYDMTFVFCNPGCAFATITLYCTHMYASKIAWFCLTNVRNFQNYINFGDMHLYFGQD